jgi:hypothetical protein
MKSSQTPRKSVTAVASRLAPEDLRPGQDVAVLTETFECPTFLWCGEIPGARPDEAVRLHLMSRDGGRPLRIKSVCLPFLLAIRPDGKSRLLDVRRVQLVKLDPNYARLVRKAIRRKSAAVRERDD